MNCKKVRKNLIKALNKDLNVNDLYEFSSHLNNCQFCSKLYNNVKTTLNLIDNYELNLDDNPYFYTHLVASLENTKTNNQSRWSLKPIFITATFALAFIVGLVIGSQLINSFSYNNSISINNKDSPYKFARIFI